jgi:hypothetical protein
MWWPWRSGQDSRRVCGSRPIDRTKGESGKTGVCWRAEPPGSRAERDLRPSPKAGAKRGGATRRFGAMRVARRASALTELSCLAVSGRRPASPAREDGSRRARQPGLDRNPPLPLPARTCRPAIRPCPERRLGYQGKPLPAGRDGNAATRLKRGTPCRRLCIKATRWVGDCPARPDRSHCNTKEFGFCRSKARLPPFARLPACRIKPGSEIHHPPPTLRARSVALSCGHIRRHDGIPATRLFA